MSKHKRDGVHNDMQARFEDLGSDISDNLRGGAIVEDFL